MATSVLAGIMVATNTARVVAFCPTLARAGPRLTASVVDPSVGIFGSNVDSRISYHGSRLFASVTGDVYEASDKQSNVVVTLYTKEGCTLCDKVKEVLREIHEESKGSDISEAKFAHSLRQIDITDDDQQESYDRYKYDIPVLHIGYKNSSSSSSRDKESGESAYWTKHRLTKEEAKEAIADAMGGSFEPRTGRPNASAMER